MYIKAYKGVDFNGDEYEEKLYFNLTKAELMEMEMRTGGGMEGLITKIINERDQEKIVDIFKELLLKSYGEKSADGKHFVKINEITGRPLYEKFQSTQAYSDMFMELATDDIKAAEFIRNVVPEDIGEEMDKADMKQDNLVPMKNRTNIPAPPMA